MRRPAIGCTVALVLVLLVAAGFGLFGSKEWRIERGTSIAATPEAVHARIADLRRWPEWSTWILDANPRASKKDADIPAAFKFRGEPGVGMTAAWTSERSHVCTLTITRADQAGPAGNIAYDLVIDGFPSTAQGTFALVPTDGGTRVTWTTWGERSDLLGGFFARLMDPMVGKKLALDLDRLRIQLEPPR